MQLFRGSNFVFNGRIVTEASKAAATAKAAGRVEEPKAAIGFTQAFMLPNVINYATAFGFFKLVNYAMFFQLPVILASHFSSSTANVISALYSVGMMPGGIVCGWVSDLYGGRRACVIATFMAVLCPLLFILGLYMSVMPVWLLLALLALMGCLVGGPNNIITSAVAADLADDPSIKGNSKALGTVTGIINGSGSVTAALGQLAIPYFYQWGIDRGVGYRYVWFFLIVCTVIGTALMGTKILKELNEGEGENQTLVNDNNRPSRSNYQAVATTDSKA
jgi:sugar phosphate permease